MSDIKQYDFLNVFLSMDDAVFAVDGEMRIVFSNKAAARLFGKSVFAKKYSNLNEAFDNPELISIIRDSAGKASKGKTAQAAVRIKDSRKNTFFMNLVFKQHTHETSSSKISVIICFAKDVREKLETESKNSVELTKLFRHWPVAMYMWQRHDDDFVLIDSNYYADQMTNGVVREFIGATARDMYTQSPDIINDLEECYEKKNSFEKEIPYYFTKTGITRDLKVRYSFLPPNSIVVLAEDITEQKENQQALIKSEERLREQFQHMPIPLYIWRRENEQFILVDFNAAAVKITRGKIKSYLGKNEYEIHGNDPDIIRRLHDCYNRRKVCHEERHFQFRATGEYVHLDVTYAFVPPDLVAVYTEDITDRYKSEAQLRDQRNELEVLLNATDDIVFLIDKNMVFTTVNKAFADRFDSDVEDFQGTEFMALSNDSIFKKRKANIEKVIQTGQPVRFQDSRGGKLYENTLYPVFNDGGEVAKVAGFGRDITDLKNHERALEENERRNRLLVENLTEGIGIVDLKERFVFINNAGAEIFGSSIEEMLQSDLFHFLDEKGSEFVKSQTNIRLADQNSRYDLSIVRSDGLRRMINVNATPMKDNKGNITGTLALFRDITEQIKTREAALESERQLRSLINATQDIAFLIDTNGICLICNDKLADLVGRPQDEIIRHNIFDMIPAEAAKNCERYVRKAVETRMLQYFEDSSGDKRFFHFINPLSEDGVNVGKLAIFTQDLTEKEAIWEKLRDTENQYQAVVETSSDGILIVQDGIIEYCNPFLTEMLDYTDEELVGSPFIHYIHEDFHEMIMGFHNRYVGGEKDMGISHILAIRRDGSLVDVDLDAGKLSYKGRPALLVTCRDVTAKKKAEQALRESEARLQLALRAVNEGLWDWNLKTNKIYFSPRFYSMLEYDPGALNLNFESWMNLIHRSERSKVRKTIREYTGYREKMFSVEFRMKTKKGDWRWILGRGMTVEYDDDGSPRRMVGTHIDISERKKDEARLQQYQSRLKSLALELVSTESRERKQIAQDLHDGVCQLLATAKLQAGVIDGSETVEQRTAGLEKIKEILEMAYGSARSLTYELSPPALHRLGFEKAVKQFMIEMSEKFGISAHCEIKGDRQRLERAQEELLYRSVRELLMNVIKHAEAKNVFVDIERKERQLKVIVEDDGKGCDDLKDNVINPKEDRGFGLFSIHEQVSNIGGRLTLESGKAAGIKAVIETPIIMNSQKTAE